jgi:rhodanese-related sulfurtransferase
VQFIIENWILFALAIVSGGLLLWPSLKGSGAGATKVTPSQAVQMMNREKAVVIDVSEPGEFAAGHVPGSRNAPLGSLESSSELPKNKALPVVVMCPTGARASRAVGLLKKAGFERVHPVAGGMGAWREANLPTEKSSA